MPRALGIGLGMAFGGRIASFSPAALFAASEVGVWYDPSDLTSMFQDSAGTTAAALEAPVGLVLDKSQGLVLGAERVANGGFDDAAEWTAGAGVTITGGVANFNVASYAGLTNTGTLQVGKTYKATVTVTNYVSGQLLIYSGGGASANRFFVPAGNGTFSGIILVGTAGFIYAIGNPTFVGTIDNISVRELPGHHASQATAASRPVLRATDRIDFDGSDDKLTAAASGGGTTGFLFVAGVNLDTIGANQTIWSDTGTNTGYRVRINSSNQLELAAGNGSAYTTVTTTETVSATTNYVIAAWHDGANLNVKLGTGGDVASEAFVTASAGTASFTLGMDNGAVSSQLNGKVYNAVYVKNFAGSLADVNNTITYVNGTMA